MTIPSSFTCFACCYAEFHLSTLNCCCTQTHLATGMGLCLYCRPFQGLSPEYQFYSSILSRNKNQPLTLSCAALYSSIAYSSQMVKARTSTWRYNNASFSLTATILHDWQSFLDASLHIYKRVCPSIRLLVRRLVHKALVKIAENGIMQDEDASHVVSTALLKICGFWRFL